MLAPGYNVTRVRGQDTSIGAGYSVFTKTQWGKILSLRSTDPKSARNILQDLAKTYWRPVYKYIRVVWRKNNEESKDLTQEFFTTIFRPEFLSRANPTRGSFRTFLLASIKNFLRDYQKYKSAAKRGGMVKSIPIENVDVPAAGSDPEKEFNRSWAQQILTNALNKLEQDCVIRARGQVFKVFKEYCLESGGESKPSYSGIADKLGISISDVTNYLFEARRELKRILEDKIKEYTANGYDVGDELKYLFTE